MKRRQRSRAWRDRLRRGLCVLACLVVVALFMYVCRGGIWNWMVRGLVVEDEIEQADIIFVHGGGLRTRFPFAVGLYKDPDLQILRVIVPGVESEERYVWEVWKKEMLPEGGLTPLRLAESGNTYDDARALHAAYRKRPFEKAIVVTDAIHSRRSRYCLKKVFAGEKVEFIFRPVRIDLEPERYFSEEDFTTYVMEEYLKLFYYRVLRREPRRRDPAPEVLPGPPA